MTSPAGPKDSISLILDTCNSIQSELKPIDKQKASHRKVAKLQQQLEFLWRGIEDHEISKDKTVAQKLFETIGKFEDYYGDDKTPKKLCEISSKLFQMGFTPEPSRETRPKKTKQSPSSSTSDSPSPRAASRSSTSASSKTPTASIAPSKIDNSFASKDLAIPRLYKVRADLSSIESQIKSITTPFKKGDSSNENQAIGREIRKIHDNLTQIEKELTDVTDLIRHDHPEFSTRLELLEEHSKMLNLLSKKFIG